jgi:hypothetical protein
VRLGAALLVAGLAAGAATGVAACQVPQQVRWETYSPDLQTQIDNAAVAKNCKALLAYDALADRTSKAHRKATGVPNRALTEYIHDALRTAGC